MILFAIILLVPLGLASGQEKCIKLGEKRNFIIDQVKQSKWNQTSYPVCAYFHNEIQQTGWSRLHVWTNPNSDERDSTLAYLAGYLEGNLTHELINLHHDNLWERYCINEKDFCNRVFRFIESNQLYVEEQVDQKRNKDSYWHQVGLILDQMAGMEAAINSKASYESGNHRINTRGKVYLNNIVGDLIELENILKRSIKSLLLGQSTCSSMVKLRADELLVGHNTWFNLGYMLRVLKKYDFNFNIGHSTINETLPGQSMSFSSYPGTIFSIDDFYLISSGLLVTETTNTNYNQSSYALVQPNGAPLTFIRNMVANRLAKDGRSWASIFSRYNSGTYNNQYMIIDYNKFTPNSISQQAGLFWVLEQMPRKIVARDMTEVLSAQGYWSSYNIPYFREIYEISGCPQLYRRYGTFFHHEDNPRARLFKRKNNEARDHESLLKLLRYNNYLHDPESRCNCTPPFSAAGSIACRGDLNDPKGNYSIPALGVINEAAIDAKVTSYKLFKQFKMFAVSGPTYENLPPFRWSTFSLRDQILHKGHPDLWVFKPIYF